MVWRPIKLAWQLSLLAVILSFSSSRLEAMTRASLGAYDQLIAPGRAVVLKAKLERARFPYWDIRGARLRFFIEKKQVGEAITDRDGTAFLYLGKDSLPTTLGLHMVTVEVVESDSYESEPAHATLLVLPTDQRIAICDLDHTVVDASAQAVALKPNEEIPSVAGAIEALHELEKDYALVYITAREELMMNKTKAWMRLNGAPAGPIYFWDLGADPYSHQAYKREQIAKLKATFPNIEVGFGDLWGDAYAYAANNMRAYILQPPLPRQVVHVVPDWNAILQDLEKQ